MQAGAGVDSSFPPLILLQVFNPLRTTITVEYPQRRRREQVRREQIPLVRMVSGQLPAIRTPPPAKRTVREKDLRQAHLLFASRFQFIEPLGHRLVHRIPRVIRVSFFDTARWNKMTEVVKYMKRNRRRSDMRNSGAFIQLAMGKELHPEQNRIVIHADKRNVALIELSRVKLHRISGKFQTLALHTTPQQHSETLVLLQGFLLRLDTNLVVHIEHREQQQKKRILSPAQPSGIQKLAASDRPPSHCPLRRLAPETRNRTGYACRAR